MLFNLSRLEQLEIKNYLNFRFEKREDYLVVQSQVVQFLEDHLTVDDCIRMEIVINEALNNSFRYAEIVDFYLADNGNCMVIQVKDNGNGFDFDTKIKDIRTNEQFVTEHTDDEFGRGLYLIDQLVDNLYFNDQGNEVIMIKYYQRFD